MAPTIVSTVTHITPKAEDLLYVTQLKCEIPECASVFKNAGHLRMHLKKHHKLPEAMLKSSEKLFFCPQLGCVYHDEAPIKRGFKLLKLLKQHFQKIHAEKKFGCTKCVKAFGTETLRDSHERNCGKEYSCLDCGWTYDSSEALLTHTKKKGHKPKINTEVVIPKVANPKVAIPRIAIPKVAIPKVAITKVAIPKVAIAKDDIPKVAIAGDDIPKVAFPKVAIPKVATPKVATPKVATPKVATPKVATPKVAKPKKKAAKPKKKAVPKDCQTQTETNTSNLVLPPKKRIIVLTPPEINNFIETSLCNIETQTEMNMISGLVDPMLYSNMCTQTCDEFLSELGLADIQTQTNWPSMDDVQQVSREPFLSGAHDELMVSTETQTSFTQCLLDSCDQENSLSGCITQHTQTCDTLLEGLFGGQGNDLIGSFQSTHTQT